MKWGKRCQNTEQDSQDIAYYKKKDILITEAYVFHLPKKKKKRAGDEIYKEMIKKNMRIEVKRINKEEWIKIIGRRGKYLYEKKVVKRRKK